MNSNVEPDREMTHEEQLVVSTLTRVQVESIDHALMQNVAGNWRKVARVVGFTMVQQDPNFSGVPDIYYAERIREMIRSGVLEAQGNPGAMRFCEVRRPKAGAA